MPTMGNPPELWAFILANTGVFLISGLLVGLSYVAYRRSDGQPSYLLTAVGFGFVMLGGLVEPLYQLVIRGDNVINHTELLWLQSGEGVFIASGLGILYYAIARHPPASTSTDAGVQAIDERNYTPSWRTQDD